MKKILFGVAALGLLGLAGAGLGLKAQDVVETKAADFSTTTRTIYVNLNDANWWNNGTHAELNNFGCRYFIGDDGFNLTSPTACTLVGLEYLYTFEIPENVDGFLFMGCKDNTPWWNYSYQTVNTSFGGDNNLFTINYVSDGANYDVSRSKLPEAVSSKVYLVNGEDWTVPKVHYWGDASASSWPGITMSLVNGIKLSANSKAYAIYEAEVPSCRYIKFSDNGGDQTGDLPMNANGVYFDDVDGKYAAVVSLLLDVKTSLGDANIASDNDKPYSDTICGIEEGDRTRILSAYTALIGDADGEIVASAMNSTLYTYDKVNYAAGTRSDIALQYIMAEFGRVSTMKFTSVESSNDAAQLPITIIAGVVSALLIGILAVRSKRERQ